MVLHPETGSDPPIGSDRESGRDNDANEPTRTSRGPLSRLGLHIVLWG